MKVLGFVLSLLLIAVASPTRAAATDDIAAALADAGRKPITADSLPTDFARLAHFTRHEANGMVLFTDSAPADGHVRHAQAEFDTTAGSRKPADRIPLFNVAIELAEEPDFTFDGFAAAMERRLGTPTASSNRPGAVFRTWILPSPMGRSVTIARAQASDNGDPITIVQLVQNR